MFGNTQYPSNRRREYKGFSEKRWKILIYVQINDEDISTSHRLPAPINLDVTGRREKQEPAIIVKFVRRDMRDKFIIVFLRLAQGIVCSIRRITLFHLDCSLVSCELFM